MTNAGFIRNYCGPDGSGKTAVMTADLIEHVVKGGVVYTFPNYELTDADGRAMSKPLNINDWLDIPSLIKNEGPNGEPVHIAVVIDEAQEVLDAERSQTQFNRLSGYICASRRHLEGVMSLYLTCPNPDWVYYRVRWMTHLLTSCFDCRWTPWGKSMKLEEGKLVNTRTWDCKGVFTGRPWTELKEFNIRAELAWNYYETHHDVDIFAGFNKVEVKGKKTKIDLNQDNWKEPAAERPPGDYVPPPPEVAAALAARQAQVENLINDLASAGNVNPAQLGKISRQLKRQKQGV